MLVALFEYDGPLDRNMIVRKHVQLFVVVDGRRPGARWS